ncbi:hypothetical protein OYT1_ch0108 [Ferriphaselus amnicola]|uniref:Schlafen group 3-like DNA/RNA helicase domain-containing protein n=1 Tax=Ferriphaselus amnicola TaxID=1188319 RepID=A0A2Z6G8G2_9PROT|nr:DUF2075 domain-containing protein [Ferriphaselus amnicola]BBE49684.1 hypothetical protein OYT1_ch0108 [Ferriphaselus amnicola]
MLRAYYSASIADFLQASTDEVLGKLSRNNDFALIHTQRDAWVAQIDILNSILDGREGSIYFEYSIPRMGRRIDAVLLIGPVIFVIEFKVGEKTHTSYAFDQVFDYALDLKNFHESSHEQYIAPVLVATEAGISPISVEITPQNDKLIFPLKSNKEQLGAVINAVLRFVGEGKLDVAEWEAGRYCPTPTIIEAAMALYNNHAVADITRSDAGATNLRLTSSAISEVIQRSKERSQKALCFVTGVPGAGKTLVGIDVATKHSEAKDDLYSVYLSGNGPLVKILCEALARDKVSRGKSRGDRVKIGEARSAVKSFIQNVHHFRDDCLQDSSAAPIEHVAIFDEAQRAWNLEQTSSFMRRKKNHPNFNQSEPEFLISCMGRHKDWATIVCLVGGGQEINTGEAGIGEWINSITRSFPDWHVYVSSRLTDSEYQAGEALKRIESHANVNFLDELHLGVSMRSFRAEDVSLLVKQLLDIDIDSAKRTYHNIKARYPIVITRDVGKAKAWLKHQARGSERYGIVVSSQAERLKPHAIDVKSPMDPVNWFLNEKDDVRSSYYLEDVATEFHVQGLELDWSCVTWDADFRYTKSGWSHHSFRGNGWNRINKDERKQYLKNAYRVLMTRARQGMVLVVPSGDIEDHTRSPQYYDGTFNYLKEIGFAEI